MTKIPFDTSKLYYGFPIFILGYKDEQYGYNITTSSSSYTLGDMMVVGCATGGNTCQQILKAREFTLNLVTEGMAAEMEIAAFRSRRDKLDLTQLSYTIGETVDAPILDKSPVTMECQLVNSVTYENYTNLIARITNRQVADFLLENDQLNSTNLNPMLFMGDGAERVYRFLDARTEELGGYMRRRE